MGGLVRLRLEAFAQALRVAELHQHCPSSEIPLIEYNVCGLFSSFTFCIK